MKFLLGFLVLFKVLGLSLTTNLCPDANTGETVTQSTPFTTVVTRTSTFTEYTPTIVFPTATLATITPKNDEEEPPTGCTTNLFSPRPTKPSASSNTQCTTALSPLTPELRQIFLDKHNEYRYHLAIGAAQLPDGSFASPASNMYKMDYSCELEAIAQTWANNCQFQHSPPEHRNGGENLYARTLSTSGTGFDIAVANSNDRWWNELQEYGGITKTNVTLTVENFNLGIGHWSQMAWGSSRTLGCGVQECPQANGKFMQLVVCNYRPTGNILNREIYTIGHPCSQDSDCTTYANSKCEIHTGLCYL